MVAEIRRLQGMEQHWRDRHPQWALRTVLLDTVTSCGFQAFSDHRVEDDLALLERAVAVREEPDQQRTGSTVERLSLACLDELWSAVPVGPPPGDLDTNDAARSVVIATPQRILLGREDEEARGDLVCWNEVNGLLEGVADPYRCASRISALAYFDAPDRYHVIDAMVALRQRYETRADERPGLDVEIRAQAFGFSTWFASDQCLPR